MMITKAFLFALHVHGEQKRKDGKPYIVHPVEVAVELARNGADEALICAGFLHDTIEDANTTPEQLRTIFGDEVARLVEQDSEDKTKSWEQRKKAALEDLEKAERSHKMLMCADKLANLRSMKEGLNSEGEDFWRHFKRGRSDQAWLFESTVEALRSLEGLPMYEELRTLTNEIFLNGKEVTHGTDGKA